MYTAIWLAGVVVASVAFGALDDKLDSGSVVVILAWPLVMPFILPVVLVVVCWGIGRRLRCKK